MEEARNEGEERHSVWSELRETLADRAINLRTLPRPLRLVVGAAYAQIVVAVVLLAVRAFGVGGAATQTLTAQGANLPMLVYAFVLVAVAIAWATLLTGAFLAHPLARAVVLVLFTLFCNALTMAGIGSILAFVPFVGLWVAFVVSLFRKPVSFERTFVPIVAVVILIGAAAFVGDFTTGELSPFVRFGSSVTTAIGGLTFVLAIVLVIAGGELGDWAVLAGTGIGAALDRVPSVPVRFVLLTIAALVLLGFASSPVPLWLIPRYVYVIVIALIAAAGGVVAVAAQSARRFGAPRIVHIPWFALAAASALYLLPILAGPVLGAFRSSSNANPDYVHFTSTEHRAPFTIAMPSRWRELDFGGATALGSLFGDGQRNGATFVTIAFPDSIAHVPAVDIAITSEEFPSSVVFIRQHGDVREFSSRRREGLERIDVVREHVGGYTWQLEERAAEPAFASARATLEYMRGSFHAGEEDAPVFDGAGAFGDIVMIVVGGVALLTLLRRFTVSAVFFAMFSVLYLGENFQHLVAVIVHRKAAVASLVGYPTVEFAATISVIAVLVILAARRHPALGRATLVLGTAIAGLAVLQAIFAMYAAAIRAGEISLAQAGIVFLALSWDIVMSGESITNGDSKAFPRPARLGMFLGYVMLVAAVILFFASLKTFNGTPTTSFESETMVRFGIVVIGLPLLLTGFVVRLIALFVTAPPAVPTAVQAAATVAPAIDSTAVEVIVPEKAIVAHSATHDAETVTPETEATVSESIAAVAPAETSTPEWSAS